MMLVSQMVGLSVMLVLLLVLTGGTPRKKR
jgi:hypothetical protein